MPTFETEQENLGIEYDELDDNLAEYIQVQQGCDLDTVEISDGGYFEIPEGYYGQIDDNEDYYEEYYIVNDFYNGFPTTYILDRLKPGKYRIVGNHIIEVADFPQMYYNVPNYPSSDNFNESDSDQSENTRENESVDIGAFKKSIENLNKEEQIGRVRQEIENISLKLLQLEYQVEDQKLKIKFLNKDIMEEDYDDEDIQWYENEMSTSEAEKKRLESEKQPWDDYYRELRKLQAKLNDEATSY